jgi:UDP-glucose 4-epimerase
MLYVGNLISALDAALAAAAPPSGAHLIADPRAVTPGELANAIGDALGRPARVRRVPVALLRLAGAVTGRSDVIRRLTAPLEVDAGSLHALLAWQPPYSLAEGLAATTAWWRSRHVL